MYDDIVESMPNHNNSNISSSNSICNEENELTSLEIEFKHLALNLGSMDQADQLGKTSLTLTLTLTLTPKS
jgi:hypothetical protein